MGWSKWQAGSNTYSTRAHIVSSDSEPVSFVSVFKDNMQRRPGQHHVRNVNLETMLPLWHNLIVIIAL